jgi:uncharacterized protein
MLAKSIFINLPVKDLARSRQFWTALGFSFNENFSDDKALCLMLNDSSIYSMLISHGLFSTFTNRPIADTSVTQVLIAIEVDSRESVDKIISTALDHGGSRYRPSTDHGWVYYDSFADPDGHQWEVMYTDMSQMQQ